MKLKAILTFEYEIDSGENPDPGISQEIFEENPIHLGMKAEEEGNYTVIVEQVK